MSVERGSLNLGSLPRVVRQGAKGVFLGQKEGRHIRTVLDSGKKRPIVIYETPEEYLAREGEKRQLAMEKNGNTSQVDGGSDFRANGVNNHGESTIAWSQDGLAHGGHVFSLVRIDVHGTAHPYEDK